MSDKAVDNRHKRSKKLFSGLIIAGWILMALGIRYIFLPIESYDMRTFLEPWYNFIAAHGQIAAFKDAFSDYSPAYLYLLSLSTLFTWIPKITAIKIISTIFDFSAAFAVYKIIKLKKENVKQAWVGFIATLYLPTVFIDSGLIGQCDIIFTSFLLWMIYALLRDQNIKALLFFSIAFAFKFQAMFAAPLLLIFFLTKKIRPYWILLPVGVYILSIVPTWLAGRPFLDLLLIYFSQANTYHLLSIDAPNIFYFFSNPIYYSNFAIDIGFGIAALLACIYLVLRWRKDPHFTKLGVLFDASLISFIFPFVLPLMHDRYFFTAALFMFLMVFMDRRALWPAILIQVTSVISYISYFHFLLPLAVVINAGLAMWLSWIFVKKMKRTPEPFPQKA
jgi:Gpi18-like mannosyltransferase